MAADALTRNDVSYIIRNLLPNKAPGPDGITNLVIKVRGLLLEKHVCNITNSHLEISLDLTAWKRSQTMILHEPNKTD